MPAEAYQSFIDELQALKHEAFEEEDDPDIKEDPLNTLNLEVCVFICVCLLLCVCLCERA